MKRKREKKMSRTYESRVPHCDRDCAGANHCTMGGVQCPDCGRWFCPDTHDSDEGGRCDACAARHREELREEAEDGE